mmetsp:Transcript_78010/g.198238  ORF Transcript_78010/g.198238 Transcript_78010/m.198238 type:complete len:200 (+) Transcript_78010:504-1103(+)
MRGFCGLQQCRFGSGQWLCDRPGGHRSALSVGWHFPHCAEHTDLPGNMGLRHEGRSLPVARVDSQGRPGCCLSAGTVAGHCEDARDRVRGRGGDGYLPQQLQVWNARAYRGRVQTGVAPLFHGAGAMRQPAAGGRLSAELHADARRYEAESVEYLGRERLRVAGLGVVPLCRCLFPPFQDLERVQDVPGGGRKGGHLEF